MLMDLIVGRETTKSNNLVFNFPLHDYKHLLNLGIVTPKSGIPFELESFQQLLRL
jgi:hypothetical protein